MCFPATLLYLVSACVCKMNPPPAEWFDVPVKVDPPPDVSLETRTKPDWLRTLEVYGFLFDAHQREKTRYK